MNPLPSFAFLIATAESLVAAVTTRDNLHLRPAWARQAVAKRLRSGMIVLRAFLRRLVIAMALDMEWHLVDRRAAMKRPHKRACKPSAGFPLLGLEAAKASPWLNGTGPQFKPVSKTGYQGAVDVDMTKLYAQLDYLSKIAADPRAKAKRLAFHLARSYQGIIIPPQRPMRIAGYWGTQVRATYDGLAASIMATSRNRPPPLPPPRTCWPSVCAL